VEINVPVAARPMSARRRTRAKGTRPDAESRKKSAKIGTATSSRATR
jgi:hypothetical protein